MCICCLVNDVIVLFIFVCFCKQKTSITFARFVAHFLTFCCPKAASWNTLTAVLKLKWRLQLLKVADGSLGISQGRCRCIQYVSWVIKRFWNRGLNFGNCFDADLHRVRTAYTAIWKTYWNCSLVMFIGAVHTQRQWRTDGVFEGSRRTEIPKALQSYANLNPNVKNVKSCRI